MGAKEQIRELGDQAATGDQARALLGAALNRLHEGYEKLGEISTIVGLRAEVESGLDVGRRQAEKLYAELPAGGAELGARQRNQVGACLWYIAGALEREQQTAEAKIGYLQGFLNGLEETLRDAGGVLPQAADLLPWWVLPAGLVVAFFYVRRLIP